MAKTDGYSKYECDRCGRLDFLASNSPSRSSWRDVSRVDASSVTTTYLFCPTCESAYKDIAATQDSTFRKFMSDSEAE